MELSSIIDIFEDYLEEHLEGKSEQLPDVLPDEIQTLLEEPAVFFLITQMGICCPYEIDSIEYKELLRWIEFAAVSFCTMRRVNPEAFQAYAQLISDVLNQTLDEETIEPEQLYAVVRVLKGHQIPVSDHIMEWLHQHYEPEFEEELDVDALSEAMVHEIRESGIRCAEDFVFMMEAELAMMPSQGMSELFASLTVFDWYVDAAVMLLSHNEASIAAQAREFLAAMPDKEWCKLKKPGYLTVLRHFVADDLKKQIDYWQRQVLRYNKAKTNKVTVVEAMACMPDGEGAAILTVLLKDKFGYALWNAVLRFDMGIAESFYQPMESKAEWTSLIEKMRKETDTHQVDPLYIKQVIPWMLTLNQETKTCLDMASLLFLSLLPAEWAKPQPANLSDMIAAHIQKPEARDVESARNISDLLLMHSSVNTWFETSLPPGCKTPRDVINKVFLADRTGLVKRMILSGLVCHFAKSAEGLERSEDIFWLNAYDLLNNPLKRKQLPLLNVLAERSLDAVKHEKQWLSSLNLMAEPDTGYVVKIELDDTRPKVWRRMTVSNKTSLLELHTIIQIAMGWEDSHLFQFIDDRDNYPTGADEYDYDQLEDVMLGMLLKKPGDHLEYVYDFGDYWQHTITLEKVQSKCCLVPKVTAGSRMCPPEDCGGIPGYEGLLKALKRRNEDDLELLEWSGWDADDFDPKEWSKESVNEQLRDAIIVE
ncbi:plasmid pRiA4b ORF-3 family protein [uncultured Photobacterium sp.]|uniref:plasmid pRiA4b ORF-3 family protein n=1 Tax=uncultured Photobacterium sp. TaxID=173973 RepID=UPI00261AA6F1|nr:plasmid pRiA4b ORF-3 family protein [uncultured Photobacterium sp.]